jgi:hypothetical protein
MHERSTEGFRSRVLTDHERALLHWLLSSGDEKARALLSQVTRARVVGRCACGCASLDLAVEGRESPSGGAQEQVSPDFFWNEPEGGLCSIHVRARHGTLAGLDTTSVDGACTPVSLPAIDRLRPQP